jgi:hypothetical protein
MKAAKRLNWYSLRNSAKRCRRVALGKLDNILTNILVFIKEHRVRICQGLLLMWVAEMTTFRNSKLCITGNIMKKGIEANTQIVEGRCRCICPDLVLAKCWILIHLNSMVHLTEEAHLKRKSSRLEKPIQEKMDNQTITMPKKQIFFCSTLKLTMKVKESFTNTETPLASRKNNLSKT